MILVGTSTSMTRCNSKASSNSVLSPPPAPTPTPAPIVSNKRDDSMRSNDQKNWITCMVVSILVSAACIAIGIIVVSRDNAESVVRFQPTNDDARSVIIVKEYEKVIGEIKGWSAPNNPSIVDVKDLERALTVETETVLGIGVGAGRRHLPTGDTTQDCVVTSTAISVGFEGCIYPFTTDQLKDSTNEDSCYTYTISIWTQQKQQQQKEEEGASFVSGCHVATALREVQTSIVSSDVYEKSIGAMIVLEEEEDPNTSTSMTTPTSTTLTVVPLPPSISPTSSTDKPSPRPTGAPPTNSNSNSNDSSNDNSNSNSSDNDNDSSNDSSNDSDSGSSNRSVNGKLLFVAPNPVPKNPRKDYFNYDIKDTKYGPGLQRKNGSAQAWAWSKVDTSKHWLREFTKKKGFGPYQGHLERKKPLKNRCNGPLYQQSPKDLRGTAKSRKKNGGFAPCLSGHEIRTKCGTKGINDKDYAKAEIFPHKLSLKLKRRQCVDGDTEDNDKCDKGRPPLVDFPKYSAEASSYSDLLNIDIKVKGEHRIEGEAFDAELQLFHTHYFHDRIGAIAIPVRAIKPKAYASSSASKKDKEFQHNVEFQKLVKVFQRVYNDHEEECNEKKRRNLTHLRQQQQQQQQLQNNNSNTTNTPIHDDEASRDFLFQNATTTADSTTTTATTTTTTTTTSTTTTRRGLKKNTSNKNPPQETRFDPYSDAFMPGIDFYRYDGSFTEPPCMYITWAVMAEPMLISMKQLQQLQTLLFTHVDPQQECRPTSVHNQQQSVARPIFPNKGDHDDGQDSSSDDQDDDDRKGFIEKCVGNFVSDVKKGRKPGKICKR